MAIYVKRGHRFEKQFAILNKKKTKILFGVKFSVGINSDTPHRFFTTASWFTLVFAINTKNDGRNVPGIHFEWNVQPYEERI